jgi:tetratricopeptide (TPR) repeat protein
MTRSTVHRLGLLVFALAWLAYGLALGGDYVFDDVHSVAANPALYDLGDLGRLLVDPSAFSGTGQRMYRPALLVSFALNMAVSPAAWSLKAGNVLCHATAAWLLWRWLRSWRVRLDAALVASALFAVHPLVSETVNLVSARSELLLGCGVLLTLVAHRRWQRRTRPAVAMAGMLLGTLVACGSKETGVVLPALLALQEFAARGRDGLDWRRALRAVLPVVLLVFGYLVLRRVLLGQATVDLLARSGGDPTMGHGRTLLVQLATMGTLLPQALWQMVVPVGMTLDPPVTFRASLFDPLVLLGWGSVFALSAAAAWPGRTAAVRRVGLTVAWLLALPWIVVPLNMPLAEHRLYGPMLGIVLVVAVSLLLVLGIVGAVCRTLDYRDEFTLWRAELAVQPDSFQAVWGLGTTYLRHGDPVGAIDWLARAHLLQPQQGDALAHYAEALVSVADAEAQPERSLAVAAELMASRPIDPWARTLAVRAHLQAGRQTGAREHFETAERLALSCLTIAEPKGYVYQLAAAARRGLGDLEGALVHLDTSVSRGLHHTDVRLDRAAVLRDLGRVADARRELLLAQQEAPMEPAVLRALFELAQPPR